MSKAASLLFKNPGDVTNAHFRFNPPLPSPSRWCQIVHCRLAMIAFTGAAVQTLIFPDKLLLG